MEPDAKLTLYEMIEMKSSQLNDGDLIFIYQEAANAYRLRFCGRLFNLEISGKLSYTLEKPDKMKYKPFRRFDSLDDFWTFFTRDKRWFMKYSPFRPEDGADDRRTVLAGFVIRATNSIRASLECTKNEFEHLDGWDRFVDSGGAIREK